MSCQSAPASDFPPLLTTSSCKHIIGSFRVGGSLRCPWYLFHRLFCLGKDTGAP
ncbi:unnamed protein product [Staurois parvus]|uniref:Uncharacterized protein n=1 Tax=Staurois parvus TaxID=386267 RepID=A0ABN9AUT5_9NEOB|nr:unnamed protein product [Staurois parvus]